MGHPAVDNIDILSVIQTPCRISPRRCHGKGTWIKMPCGHCRGVGQVKTKQKVMVPVPAGIEDGQTVRMPVGKKEVKCSSYIVDTLGS